MTMNRDIDTAERREMLDLARERHCARVHRLDKWRYLQFVGSFRGIPEGTAVFGDTWVWGYPKIGRIVQLDTGIPAQFEQPFWVEEKIDGYNVRIFRHGDDTLVLTRRGYPCPFTMDRLEDLLDPRILEERPDLVICAEVAGPDNPYNEGSPPFITADVRLFVFDMMYLGRPGFLPYGEKLRLVEGYGLPAVSPYGRHGPEDVAKLKALMLELDREGREGIVLKEDSPRDQRVKYVTGSSNIADIQVNEGNIQQLPAEYFMHRILRLALFIEEHELPITPAMQQALSKALVDGTVDAIKQYRDNHKVFNTFRCRFRQRDNAELMMRAMKRRLRRGQMRQRRLTREGDYYVLEFDKILPRTTGLFAQLLKGGIVFD